MVIFPYVAAPNMGNYLGLMGLNGDIVSPKLACLPSSFGVLWYFTVGFKVDRSMG